MVAGANTPKAAGLLLRSLRDPPRLLLGDTAVEEGPAEHAISGTT